MKIFNMILKPFYELRKTIYKLKRSCRWFVRTWNNYDWDYDYLIQMMVSKMEDMRYQFDVTDKNFIDLNFSSKNDIFSKAARLKIIACLGHGATWKTFNIDGIN